VHVSAVNGVFAIKPEWRAVSVRRSSAEEARRITEDGISREEFDRLSSSFEHEAEDDLCHAVVTEESLSDEVDNDALTFQFVEQMLAVSRPCSREAIGARTD